MTYKRDIVGISRSNLNTFAQGHGTYIKVSNSRYNEVVYFFVKYFKKLT
jgi:hypothetical protein